MKKKYTYLIIIFLIVASFAAFGRIAGNEFINFDDNEYITENSHIQSGINPASIKWALTAVVQGNWHPLTMISHMLDWSLFGANASGHHLISLFLHIGSAILLFLFLNKATKNIWPAAFVAAFFTLHPLRVESVAWAAERKDVLSMFLGMASIYAYAFYAERPDLRRYFLCWLLFALALLAKPMLVTLPFILLLLDYWPLGRWPKALAAPAGKRLVAAGRLLGEKVPFILLTVASSIVTFWLQNKAGAIVSTERLPFLERVANALISYAAYLGKTFWPIKLAVFYPYDFSLSLGRVLISGVILLVITVAVLYFLKKLPFLFVGWFWYLGTLVPVIGLVQVGIIHIMADRYTYLPSIGIAVILAWGIPLLMKREDLRKMILFPVAIVILAILAVCTWCQCGYWKNSIELWNHTLWVTEDNSLAHNNLGVALVDEEKIAEALAHYNKAISLKPDYSTAYNNRGIIFLNQGNKKLGCYDAQKACTMGNCKTLEVAKGKGLCP